MTKFDLGILILAGLSIIGLIYLLVLKIDTTVLMPIVTALIAYLLGNKKNEIVGYFKK